MRAGKWGIVGLSVALLATGCAPAHTPDALPSPAPATPVNDPLAALQTAAQHYMDAPEDAAPIREALPVALQAVLQQ